MLLEEFNIPYSDCFLLDCLLCNCYCCVHYPLKSASFKNWTGSDLADKTTVPCLLFCYQKLLVDNA